MQLIDLSSKRQSLTDLVRQRLSRAIVSGELAAGEKLAEPDLAAKLNVSRAPIREALIALEFDGLVQSDSRGRVVAPRLSRSDLEEILLMRRGLEPAACQRAAEIITDSQLQLLKSNLEKSILATSHSEVARLDTEFHDLIIQASGLKRVLHAWHGICYQVELLLNQMQSTIYPELDELKQMTVTGHQQIILALQTGDKASAHTLMFDHMDGWMSILDTLPESTPQ